MLPVQQTAKAHPATSSIPPSFPRIALAASDRAVQRGGGLVVPHTRRDCRPAGSSNSAGPFRKAPPAAVTPSNYDQYRLAVPASAGATSAFLFLSKSKAWPGVAEARPRGVRRPQGRGPHAPQARPAGQGRARRPRAESPTEKVKRVAVSTKRGGLICFFTVFLFFLVAQFSLSRALSCRPAARSEQCKVILDAPPPSPCRSCMYGGSERGPPRGRAQDSLVRGGGGWRKYGVPYSQVDLHDKFCTRSGSSGASRGPW